MFIYNWLSLLTKKSVFVFLSILSNFSDLGLFFILSLSTFSTTSFFGWLIDFFTNYVLAKFKKFLEKKKKNQNDCDHIIDDILPFLFIYFFLSGFIILFFSVIYKWLFYGSIAYEIGYLLYAISPLYRLNLKYTKNFKIRYNLSNDENTTNEENANSDHLNDINNSNINDKCSTIDNNECITATNKCSSINDEANDINSEYSLEYIEEINNNSYSDTNINDENDDDDYSNVINLDDVINNIEAFITTENNIVNAIDINDIIINFNSNINKVNEKIETINSFSSAWRFLYYDTNETIHNLNINKPHKKKIHKIKYPGFYFDLIKGKLNDDVDNLTQIKKLNDSLCELNNKYFVKFVSNIKKKYLNH